jgi:iron complex outermembrane receptor protein
VDGLSGVISYDVGSVTIKNTTSFRRAIREVDFDLDASPFNFLASTTHDDIKQWFEELSVSGKMFGERLNYVAGLNYFEEFAFEDSGALAYPDVTTFTSLAAGFLGPSDTRFRGQFDNRALAAFLQSSYDITDALSITGGVRYSVENRDETADNFTRYLGANNATVCNIDTSILSSPRTCSAHFTNSFREPSYLVSLDYKLGKDKLVYITTGHSYRAGGINAYGASAATFNFFPPELSTNYEAGLKADWFNRHLRTNLSAFFTRYENMQTPISVVDPKTGAIAAVIADLGNADVKGVELQIDARPINWLQLFGTLGYTESALDHPSGYVPAPGSPYQTDLPLTAPVTASLGFQASDALTNQVIVVLRTDFSFSDGVSQPFAAEIVSPAHAVLNMNLSATHEPTGIRMSLFAKNLTDRRYYSYANFLAGQGISVAQYAAPRQIGLQLMVPFGSEN